MALIKCPECGTMFSEFASECPKCACPVEIAKKATVESSGNKATQASQHSNGQISKSNNSNEPIKQQKTKPAIKSGIKEPDITNLEKIRKIGMIAFAIILLVPLCLVITHCTATEEKTVTSLNENDTIFIINDKTVSFVWKGPDVTGYTTSILTKEECDSIAGLIGWRNYVFKITIADNSYPNRIIKYYNIEKNKEMSAYYYSSLEEASKAFIESEAQSLYASIDDTVNILPKYDNEFKNNLLTPEEAAKKKAELDKEMEQYRKEREAEEAEKIKKEKPDFLKRLKDACWQEDVDVTWSGTTITFTGYQFATNKNIQYFQTKIQSDLKKYGFKRVKYRWSKGASEYTYYDI